MSVPVAFRPVRVPVRDLLLRRGPHLAHRDVHVDWRVAGYRVRYALGRWLRAVARAAVAIRKFLRVRGRHNRSRFASALMTLASIAKPSPPTNPSSMQRLRTASKTRRNTSLWRNRPCRFLEEVE